MIRLSHSLLLLGTLYGALALPSHLDSLDKHLAGRDAQADLAPRAPAEAAPDTSHLVRLKYDKIKPLPETIPANATGELYRKYQPYFYVNGGCSPYVAIDGDASINDATWVEDVKDGAGHRHDWENAVIWLNKKKTKIVAVAPSAHGGYKVYAKTDFNFKRKTHALVGYGQPYDMAMVAWESMTDAMRLAIETPGSFDGCTPGIRDSEWDGFMKKAYPSPDILED